MIDYNLAAKAIIKTERMKTIHYIKVSAGLSVLLILLAAYALTEPYFIETKEITVKNRDIPDSFNGKTIVFVSDIHYGPFFSRERVRDLVNRINALEPDIVLLGGDDVDHIETDAAPCYEELANLKAPLGKYSVPGNHEWGREKLAEQEMKEAGITPLRNSAVWIHDGNESIRIGGVGDFWHDSQDIGPTIGEADESDYVLLLSHNPDYAGEIETDKIDLVLSGHTHGGQVTFFGLFAPYTNSKYGQKYRSGFAETDHTTVYVTRGVGTTFLPVRFFSRPEITVIRLQRE